MFSTENRFSTGYQSPPRPPSQRLPRVAAGSQHDDDDHNMILSGAGSSLTTRPLGLKDGVHLITMLTDWWYFCSVAFSLTRLRRCRFPAGPMLLSSEVILAAEPLNILKDVGRNHGSCLGA